MFLIDEEQSSATETITRKTIMQQTTVLINQLQGSQTNASPVHNHNAVGNHIEHNCFELKQPCIVRPLSNLRQI